MGYSAMRTVHSGVRELPKGRSDLLGSKNGVEIKAHNAEKHQDTRDDGQCRSQDGERHKSIRISDH